MDDIDFLRRRPPAPPWAWALLASAALASAAAGLELVTSVREAGVLSAQAKQLENARVRTERARQGSTDAAATRGPRDDARRQLMLRQRAAWASTLHRPWLELLDSLERSAAPEVPLQQITVDARFEGVQLQVEAMGMPDLFAYLTRLEHSGRPIRSVQLVGHEWDAPSAARAGARTLRARIALRLDPAAAPSAANGEAGAVVASLPTRAVESAVARSAR